MNVTYKQRQRFACRRCGSRGFLVDYSAVAVDYVETFYHKRFLGEQMFGFVGRLRFGRLVILYVFLVHGTAAARDKRAYRFVAVAADGELTVNTAVGLLHVLNVRVAV